MQDYPMDCLIGKISSIVKKKNHFDVILFVDNFYGDFSLYGKSTGQYVNMTLNDYELIRFKDFILKNYDYYVKEFDKENELHFSSNEKNSDLTNFSKMKLVTEGIVIGIKGEIGTKIFENYGATKFAGFIFMNKNLFNGLKSLSFNNILMTSELKQELITQNTFNFLIPVGNLKSSLSVVRTALIAS